MKRLLIAGVAACGFVGAGAAASAAAPARTQLRGSECQRALEPAARTISVVAVMRPLDGTKKMELRFRLLSKSKTHASFTEVAGGNLGSWISPANPTLGQRAGDVWIVRAPVVDLSAPATYRFRVGFRWIGENGRVLGAVERLSQSCFQPELRPDLLVKSILVRAIAGKPRLASYTPTIANDGATAAGPFEVEFLPGPSLAPKLRTVNRVRAHMMLALRPFVGPACTSQATAPTVIVDPDHQVVDDLNPASNSLTATCPAASGRPGRARS